MFIPQAKFPIDEATSRNGVDILTPPPPRPSKDGFRNDLTPTKFYFRKMGSGLGLCLFLPSHT